MQKNALIAVAAGLLSATFHLSTHWGVIGVLVLGLFAPLPLFLAGLGLGLTGAGIATGVALLTVFAVADLQRLFIFLAADGLPALIVVRFALLNRVGTENRAEWYPPGHLLTWIALYGAAAFVAASLFTGTGSGGLESAISNYIEGLRALVAEADRANPAVEHMIGTIKRVFPFLVVTWWIVILSINATLAQRFLVKRDYNLRPSPDLLAIYLPQWLAGIVVAGAVAALLGSGWLGFMATNITLILCVPYFLVGLAVVHAISTGWGGRTAILWTLYLFLLLFGWPALVIIGTGFLEHWINLRERFRSLGQSNERNE